MKRTIYFFTSLFFLTIMTVNCQVPWMKDVEDSDGKIYYDKVIQKAEEYFNSMDNHAKGSGYKQFMRWKEIWKYRVKSDGSLPNPTNIIESWKNKQEFQLNQNSNNGRSVIGEWESLGPFSHNNSGSWSSGQGRVNVITVDPNNSNTIYIGAPDGGLWKSSDNGDTWMPLAQNLPSIGISGIAVSPSDSNTIYISTGDEDGSDTLSAGIYKSTNGGITWNQVLAAENLFSVSGEIYIDPSNANNVYTVTNNGFFKTTNGGNTWTRTLLGNTKELRIKPDNPSTIYVVTNDSFYISNDAGNSFQLTATNNFFTGAGRIVIDVTPANPNYIYASVANSNYSFRGIFRSTDSGTTFTARNTSTDIHTSNQAWFDYAIAVSDTDADKIFTGVLDVWTSDNGGSTMTQVNNWSDPFSATYTHADIHFLKYYNGTLYCGSDGGIYLSENNGSSFTDKTAGINIGQFYRISLGETTNNIAGGLQDNGGYAYNNGSGVWSNYHGADGMDNVISTINPTDYYGFIQFGGSLYKTNVSTNQSDFVASSNINGNWITPLAINSAGDIFAGYDRIYKLDEGNSTFVLHSIRNMGSGNIDRLVIDPSNDNNVWSVKDDIIYKSTDGGMTQRSINPNEFNFIDWLDVHPNDSNLIYVLSSNRVFKSVDGGITWLNITNNLPTSNSLQVIKGQSNTGSNLNSIYVGTSGGDVYYYDDDLGSWTTFSNQLPNASISDIEINVTEGNIVVATYGRGVWRSPVHERSLLNVTDLNSDEKELLIYPNPTKHEFFVGIDISERTNVKVYDFSGKLLMNKNYEIIRKDESIEVNNLATGNYIIKITSANHLITKKLTIVK